MFGGNKGWCMTSIASCPEYSIEFRTSWYEYEYENVNKLTYLNMVGNLFFIGHETEFGEKMEYLTGQWPETCSQNNSGEASLFNPLGSHWNPILWELKFHQTPLTSEKGWSAKRNGLKFNCNSTAIVIKNVKYFYAYKCILFIFLSTKLGHEHD